MSLEKIPRSLLRNYSKCMHYTNTVKFTHMKQVFYNRIWRPFKKWVKKILKQDNDHDNYFDHPYVIF